MFFDLKKGPINFPKIDPSLEANLTPIILKTVDLPLRIEPWNMILIIQAAGGLW